MKITNNQNRVIYDGQDGFVATFHDASQNGESLMKVDCYSPSSFFSPTQVQQLLIRAADYPIGYGYDVRFHPDIDSIVFSKGLTLERGNSGLFLIIATSAKSPNRFIFYTNAGANTNASDREDTFHSLVRTLLASITAAMHQATPSSPPLLIVGDEYDDIAEDEYGDMDEYDDDDEYISGNYYEVVEDDTSLYPEVSEEVYSLYTCNFLFNLFGDQLLAVVCSSKDEYNRFVAMLQDIGIITAPSLNSNGWNDVTKYIMFDAERNTAYAVCHLPKTVDVVLPVSDFLAKIYRDAKELLNEEE